MYSRKRYGILVKQMYCREYTLGSEGGPDVYVCRTTALNLFYSGESLTQSTIAL